MQDPGCGASVPCRLRRIRGVREVQCLEAERGDGWAQSWWLLAGGLGEPRAQGAVVCWGPPGMHTVGAASC